MARHPDRCVVSDRVAGLVCTSLRGKRGAQTLVDRELCRSGWSGDGPVLTALHPNGGVAGTVWPDRFDMLAGDVLDGQAIRQGERDQHFIARTAHVTAMGLRPVLG